MVGLFGKSFRHTTSGSSHTLLLGEMGRIGTDVVAIEFESNSSAL